MQHEVFIVKRPKGILGAHTQIIVQPHNFKQLQGDKECLYYDKESGEKFATVNDGMWYNNGLLYHILTEKR